LALHFGANIHSAPPPIVHAVVVELSLTVVPPAVELS
jgi:hypothetical protein